jgi:hypothetical protein
MLIKKGALKNIRNQVSLDRLLFLAGLSDVLASRGHGR